MTIIKSFVKVITFTLKASKFRSMPPGWYLEIIRIYFVQISIFSDFFWFFLIFFVIRDSVHVTAPAKEESKENFSPSGWHVYRNKVIETGTRSSVYKDQVSDIYCCYKINVNFGGQCYLLLSITIFPRFYPLRHRILIFRK